MQTALICFELIARIHQIQIDLRTITREHGIREAELTREDLLLVLKNLGFKARLKKMPPEKLLEKYPPPAIAIFKDGTYGVLT